MRDTSTKIYTNYKHQLKEWLSEYDFTHAITLSSLNATTKTAVIDERLSKWARGLEKQAKMQIGYIGVFNKIPYPHCHILVAGGNYQGNTLFDILDDIWDQMQRAWHGSVKIQSIYDQQGIVSYDIDQNMPTGQSELLTPYNATVLRKIQIQHAQNQPIAEPMSQVA